MFLTFEKISSPDPACMKYQKQSSLLKEEVSQNAIQMPFDQARKIRVKL